MQMLSNKDFIRKLDETIERHSMLRHPFYQAWIEGALTRGALGEYAKQYYEHVRNFPIYLSATHSRCDDLQVRQLLLENLIEEEKGDVNHPELWLRFAEGLGVDRGDVEKADLLPETVESVNVFKRMTTSDNYLKGVAALYAYESQIPEVAKTKRDGLKACYGIDDERTVSYFSVHEEADVLHRAQEQEILERHADTAEAQQVVLDAAEAGAKAVLKLLDGIYENYVAHAA